MFLSDLKRVWFFWKAGKGLENFGKVWKCLKMCRKASQVLCTSLESLSMWGNVRRGFESLESLESLGKFRKVLESFEKF